MASVSNLQIGEALKGMSIKDLRQQCRARNINPAGSVDVLRQRLTENMHETNDVSVLQHVDQSEAPAEDNYSKNNFARPDGRQNMGNRVTDRPSSRVSNPPGGASQLSFGDYELPSQSAHRSAVEVRKAEQGFHGMGLGDADDLGAQNDYSQVAAGRSTGTSQGMNTGARLFNVEADGSSVAPEYQRNNSRGPNGHTSQLAFGDHQLPSSMPPGGARAPESRNRADAANASLLLDVDSIVKPLTLNQLRSNCRARGLQPAGGVEQLRERLGTSMIATGDMELIQDGISTPQSSVPSTPNNGMSSNAPSGNNYARPGGQNVGNFISDRPSSRVLAPPGGVSQIAFGDYGLPQNTPTGGRGPAPPSAPAPYATYPDAPSSGQSNGYGASAGASTNDVMSGRLSNNYSRPNGQQNVGNFLTDRNSTRVVQPPGGRSQITFG
mmetsp:Transcript_972/g.1533  ORF Transcript_972/g.1533 Transcript_972/m.1533 type:complete len:438 (-) Transcript_972:833-2146(-)